MHPQTVFTKTAKGVLEVKNRTIRLPRHLGLVFLVVDGKSPVSELPRKARLDEETVTQALEKLVADDYIKVFYAPPATGEAAPAADDLDFTSPEKVAQLNREAEQRAKAEADAKARAETAARAAAEAKARQQAETRAHAAAEAKAKQETAAKLKAEQEARAAALASAKAQVDVKAATGVDAKAE